MARTRRDVQEKHQMHPICPTASAIKIPGPYNKLLPLATQNAAIVRPVASNIPMA